MSLNLRFLLITLFGLYVCLWPGSTILVALGRVPAWGVWIGGALLILQGVLMGLWFVANYGRRGAVASLVILVISWAVEHLGATTGFPFGSYGYTTTLQPQISGVVPLAIPFAWLLVVPAAIGVAEQLLAGWSRFIHRHAVLLAIKIVVAAGLALLLDITIEPVAVHVNDYWIWRDSGMYYGIPASNFVGWWATSAILVVLTLFVIPLMREDIADQSSHRRILPLLPRALYLLNLLMFVLVNLAYDQLLAGAIGIVLLIVLVAHGVRRRGNLFLLWNGRQTSRDKQ